MSQWPSTKARLVLATVNLRKLDKFPMKLSPIKWLLCFLLILSCVGDKRESDPVVARVKGESLTLGMIEEQIPPSWKGEVTPTDKIDFVSRWIDNVQEKFKEKLALCNISITVQGIMQNSFD